MPDTHGGSCRSIPGLLLSLHHEGLSQVLNALPCHIALCHIRRIRHLQYHISSGQVQQSSRGAVQRSDPAQRGQARDVLASRQAVSLQDQLKSLLGPSIKPLQRSRLEHVKAWGMPYPAVSLADVIVSSHPAR